jgi:hypothetical protein
MALKAFDRSWRVPDPLSCLVHVRFGEQWHLTNSAEMGAKRTLTARSANFRSWHKCDVLGCPLYGCSWNRTGRPTNAICIHEYAA